MAAIDKIDACFDYEVKIELYDENDCSSNKLKKEEITIEPEVFYKETFSKLTMYEDLILEAPRLCSLCDRIFPNSYSFLQHNTVHLNISLQKSNIYSCSRCSACFFSTSDLEDHTRSHHFENNNDTSMCPVCNKHVETGTLNKHINLSHREKLKCNMCGVFISSEANLKRHIVNSHEQKNKKCEHCGKIVKARYYGTHVNKVHKNDKVKCDLCCKYFKSKACLTQHKLFIHKKDRTRVEYDGAFKCDMCSAVFKDKNRLTSHVAKCQGEVCKYCGAILKTKQILKNHIRWVHYDDGKIHSCDVCGKVFKSPYAIKTHKKNSHASTSVMQENEAR